MLIPFLVSKIHRATVTEVNPDYPGSISIDEDLMKEAGFREFQKVEVYNISSGQRFNTYLVAAQAGTGHIILNGAATHPVKKGDRINISAYALLDERELNSLNSVIVSMKEDNKIEKILTGKL